MPASAGFFMPAEVSMSEPVEFERGSNSAIQFQFQDEDGATIPISGSTFRLSVSVRGQIVIELNSASDSHLVVDSSTNELIWNRTLAESRLVPLGNLAVWELERRVGSAQERWGTGRFRGIGGLNDD